EQPLDKKAATAGNGITIGLEAPDRASVDKAHAAAMAAGGSDEGKPGLRTHYHPNYYGAYLRDPDGNKVCIVCQAHVDACWRALPGVGSAVSRRTRCRLRQIFP